MKNILYIGNQLRHKNVTVTSVDTLGDLLRKEGYTLYTSSDKKNKIFRLLDMCFAVLNFRKKVDIVLIDTYSTLNFHYAVIVSWLCRRMCIEYIPLLRGGNLPKRLYKNKKLSDPLFRKAKINVAPSAYLMQAFQQAGFSNLIHIPNTIQIENYLYKQRKYLQPKILWVRAFDEIYNPMLALETLQLILKKHSGATLTMVGPEKDGSLEKCRQYAKTNQLPVIFTEKLSKPEWIHLAQDFDIFINTTNFDNTPVSVIEAMALGLVVITTNVGGIPFLLDDGVNAILIPPENPAAMAEAIVKTISDPELSDHLSQRARKKAETFDWQKVKPKWHSILN